jgi:L-asparaginase/Glu-tRNA(Gln) amidotransferase subunit D
LAQARQTGQRVAGTAGRRRHRIEERDDELDYVVSDTLSPQKARILVMLALTKTSNTKEIQRMFYTY